MNKLNVAILCCMILTSVSAMAQENNTAAGATQPATQGGGGSVNIQQDQRLQNIVSGQAPVVERRSNEGTQQTNQQNNSDAPRPSQPRRVQRTQVVPVNQLPTFGKSTNNFDLKRGTRKRMRGFRIQMYWGNSLRTDYLRAKRLGDKVVGAFPELKSYVSFDQPHWRCRVGDFKTRAGAARYLERMRKIAPEAMIVRSEIYIYQ